jgi:hypothetical protein
MGGDSAAGGVKLSAVTSSLSRGREGKIMFDTARPRRAFSESVPHWARATPFASHMSSLSRATKLPSSELSWRLLSNTRRCRSRCRSRTGRNRARAPGRRRFGSGIVCRCADGLRSRTMSCGLFAFAAPTTKRPFAGAARTARASSLPRRWRYDVGLGSLQDTS